MTVWFPIALAFGLLTGSLFSGWQQPVRPEEYTLRVGHGIARNDAKRPSGFQITHLLPSLEVPLTGTVGPRWARGRIVWNPELQLALFSVPNVRPLFGAHPLQMKYELEPIGKWTPYFLGGVGGVYSNIERPETGSDGNFSFVSALGTRYRLNDSADWLIEYRHQHLSNNDADRQNSGVDAETVLTGFSLKF